MRGRFTPGPRQASEWCERRLLARIHRYTVNRLRAEIEPVETRDFLRFLFEWQRVAPEARMEGPDAVAAVLAQLEGFEAPAGAWETEILPARVNEYDPAWLDEHASPAASSGRGSARRRAESGAAAGPVRSTPIALLARATWRSGRPLWREDAGAALGSSARRVLEFIGGTAPRSSMRSSRAPGCCRRRPRKALA